MPRKSVLKDVISDINKKTVPVIEKQQVPTETEDETVVEPEKEVPTSVFTLTIPTDKVPEQMKESIVGEEITVQVVGNIMSKDENGIVLDLKTIEVV